MSDRFVASDLEEIAPVVCAVCRAVKFDHALHPIGLFALDTIRIEVDRFFVFDVLTHKSVGGLHHARLHHVGMFDERDERDIAAVAVTDDVRPLITEGANKRGNIVRHFFERVT